MGPGLAAIGSLVDAVALHDIAAQLRFTHPDVHHIGVGGSYSKCAHGRALDLAIRHGLPGRPAIGRLPDAATHRAEVVLVGPTGASRNGEGTAAAIRADVAPHLRSGFGGWFLRPCTSRGKAKERKWQQDSQNGSLHRESPGMGCCKRVAIEYPMATRPTEQQRQPAIPRLVKLQVESKALHCKQGLFRMTTHNDPYRSNNRSEFFPVIIQRSLEMPISFLGHATSSFSHVNSTAIHSVAVTVFRDPIRTAAVRMGPIQASALSGRDHSALCPQYCKSASVIGI